MANSEIQFPPNPGSGDVFSHTFEDNGAVTEIQYRYTDGEYWIATGTAAMPRDLDSRYVRTIGDRIFGQFHSEINVTGNIDTESRPELPGPNNGTNP